MVADAKDEGMDSPASTQLRLNLDESGNIHVDIRIKPSNFEPFSVSKGAYPSSYGALEEGCYCDTPDCEEPPVVISPGTENVIRIPLYEEMDLSLRASTGSSMSARSQSLIEDEEQDFPPATLATNAEECDACAQRNEDEAQRNEEEEEEFRNTTILFTIEAFDEQVRCARMSESLSPYAGGMGSSSQEQRWDDLGDNYGSDIVSLTNISSFEHLRETEQAQTSIEEHRLEMYLERIRSIPLAINCVTHLQAWFRKNLMARFRQKRRASRRHGAIKIQRQYRRRLQKKHKEDMKGAAVIIQRYYRNLRNRRQREMEMKARNQVPRRSQAYGDIAKQSFYGDEKNKGRESFMQQGGLDPMESTRQTQHAHLAVREEPKLIVSTGTKRRKREIVIVDHHHVHHHHHFHHHHAADEVPTLELEQQAVDLTLTAGLEHATVRRGIFPSKLQQQKRRLPLGVSEYCDEIVKLKGNDRLHYSPYAFASDLRMRRGAPARTLYSDIHRSLY